MKNGKKKNSSSNLIKQLVFSFKSVLNRYLTSLTKGEEKATLSPRYFKLQWFHWKKKRSLTYKILLVSYCAQLIFVRDSNMLIALKELQQIVFWLLTLPRRLELTAADINGKFSCFNCQQKWMNIIGKYHSCTYTSIGYKKGRKFGHSSPSTKSLSVVLKSSASFMFNISKKK